MISYKNIHYPFHPISLDFDISATRAWKSTTPFINICVINPLTLIAHGNSDYP